MVVTSGEVPGVTPAAAGTSEAPAARVTLWSDETGRWRSTGETVAVKTCELGVIDPLDKAWPSASDAVLVALHNHHRIKVEQSEGPAYRIPSAAAVKEVFRRGTAAWPGEVKTQMSDQEWALARVMAFLDMAAGHRRDSYIRDMDLLPEGHPFRAR
jgi:hypothetical protein